MDQCQDFALYEDGALLYPQCGWSLYGRGRYYGLRLACISMFMFGGCVRRLFATISTRKCQRVAPYAGERLFIEICAAYHTLASPFNLMLSGPLTRGDLVVIRKYVITKVLMEVCTI